MHQEEREPTESRRYSEVIDTLVAVTEKLPQVNVKVVHLFSKGYYARVLSIPADTLVVAKLHKTRHFYALVSGHMRILEGGAVHEVQGPTSGVSARGVQRVGHAITDSVFMTVHKTNKTTLAEIEAEVIATSEEELWLGQ